MARVRFLSKPEPVKSFPGRWTVAPPADAPARPRTVYGANVTVTSSVRQRQDQAANVARDGTALA
jgi:hypothetical protein